MIRVCCSRFHWGDKVFGEKEPFGNKEETHGFCENCFRLETEYVMEQQEKMREMKVRVAKEGG